MLYCGTAVVGSKGLLCVGGVALHALAPDATGFARSCVRSGYARLHCPTNLKDSQFARLYSQKLALYVRPHVGQDFVVTLFS
jgi:hypothetical protein